MTSDDSDVPHRESRLKEHLGRIIQKINPKKSLRAESPRLLFDYSACSRLNASQQEMIRGVIELTVKIAREIMIPRVDIIAVSADTPLRSLMKIVVDGGHSRIPVYADTIDNITGILYVKDLLKYINERPRRFELRKILHRPYYVPETMALDDLLVEFKRRKLHMACVVDEYGGFGGIVTLEDILEEIVGEIKDEFDDDELPELKRIGKKVYDVDSRMALSDFNNETGASLPVEEFDTIGGYVLDLFGKIPGKNETVRSGGLSFRIKEIKGTRIIRIIANLNSE